MKAINLIVLSVAFACFTFFAAPAEAAGMKIGVVNLQKAVNNTKEGQAGTKRIGDKMKREQGIMQKKEAELKSMQEQLQTQAYSMSESERMAKQEKLQKLALDFKLYRENVARTFQTEQQEVIKKIYNGLKNVITEYAKKQGFTMIIEGGTAPGTPGTVIYNDAEIDITDTVVKLYDAKYSK